MDFKDVKNDYLRLMAKWGYPNDMTGAFVDAEKMEKVVLNPTKKNAAEYMKEVIHYGFQFGYCYYSEHYGKVSINECALLTELYEKYMY